MIHYIDSVVSVHLLVLFHCYMQPERFFFFLHLKFVDT